ncbi:NADPH-dependent oxidoreductase [Pectinatus haikarae]|uniref:FMN reductase [NAD(P)H] n=1 Tax=Pectinatus haikarae TaxID=349096 RepID=A0ABT9YBQ9_9FIRM|nr:NADPH-dependent oxidoreductase [Pectinatus haikarae]MDQ0204539.1 FMN reductase [NAD(P)H] [Pectinatus haikarae]
MKDVIETIKNHRSIRHYLDKPIPDAVLNEILQAAQSMPTSINGQQLSLIVIKDKNKRQKIAHLTGDQPWIAQAPVLVIFTADFYRSDLACRKNGQRQVIHESVEGTLVGAVDAGIAMGAAIIAAESLGLGIVPIGAVRRDPAQMINLLELPPYTYPLVGLVIGYPADPSALKPRFPSGTFVHEEVYQKDGVQNAIDEYDKKMEDYYKERGDKQTDWSSQVTGAYKQVYFPQVYPTMKKQGFLNDK